MFRIIFRLGVAGVAIYIMVPMLERAASEGYMAGIAAMAGVAVAAFVYVTA